MTVSNRRIVLDTNVCLDMFVFQDDWTRPLLASLVDGQLQAVTKEDCRAEWHRVLGYSQFGLDQAAQDDAARAFDARISCLTDAQCVMPESVRLPRCADPDDQKFLELALVSGAQWLVSKDREVLRLGRRTAREGWFQILSPDEWLRQWTTGTAEG